MRRLGEAGRQLPPVECKLWACMTFCFVASIPGIVVAAADTRVIVHPERGRPVSVDGPHDFRVEVESLGRSVVIPYRQRKIRFLGAGWAVAAGAFTSATLLLDELRDAKASSFEMAKVHLDRVRDSLEQRAQRDTGVPVERLRETLVIGGDLSDAGGAWTLAFDSGDPRTHANAGQFVANTPFDVPTSVSQAAEQVFVSELQTAFQTRNAIGLVKAAARRIGVVSQHTKQASSRAQIGVTINDPGVGRVSRY